MSGQTGSHPVYLALGTNLGDRMQNLRSARAALPPAVRLSACSPVYETPPWGYTDQPAFLNQVVAGETDLSPHDLLHYLKEVEKALGRQATFRNGPRLIDLDILLYDDLILDSDSLVIPHPRMLQRAFVLRPLADLAPDLAPPGGSRTIRQMLAELDDSGIVLYAPAAK